MNELPSSSKRRAFSPRAMKSGSPPTPLKARTGLFTPPGKRPQARANSRCDASVFRGMAGQGLAPLPATVKPLRCLMRSGASGAGQPAIPDGGIVVRIDRAAAVEAALGALQGELHRLGRIVPHQRRGERLDGRLVVAALRQAVALLEERLGGLLRAMVLALHFVVGGDGVCVAAGEVVAGSREQRRSGGELRSGPAALQLGGRGAR